MTDAEMIEVIVQAVRVAAQDFFKTWCPLSLKDTSVTQTAAQGYEIAGIIAISGAWRGSIAVHINRALATKITQTVLKASRPSEADVFDMVGELSNLVSGGVKNGLAPAGIPIEISCPTVVAAGANLHTVSGKRGHTVNVNFTADREPLTVTISVGM